MKVVSWQRCGTVDLDARISTRFPGAGRSFEWGGRATLLWSFEDRVRASGGLCLNYEQVVA